MTNELVERLLRKDNWTQHKPEWHLRNPDGPEAAAEIERLRAVVKGLLIEFVGPHEEGYNSVVNARAALKGDKD